MALGLVDPGSELDFVVEAAQEIQIAKSVNKAEICQLALHREESMLE